MSLLWPVVRTKKLINKEMFNSQKITLLKAPRKVAVSKIKMFLQKKEIKT
jgi:hypothetical protein